MLYDPKWEKPEVKADPFSLESLIAWLEKQPADRAYNFRDCLGRCLLGQYMTSVGIDWNSRVDERVAYNGFCDRLPAAESIAVTRPWTFGAALARARRALARLPT